VHIASKSPVVASTAFFLPDIDVRHQEREYCRLQECAQRSTGFPPIESRIERLSCRIGGKDCTVEVGGVDPVDGTTVVAILDLGRHLPYGVFTSADPDAPAHLVGKRIYSLSTFT
jgi:hypothetical protein